MMVTYEKRFKIYEVEGETLKTPVYKMGSGYYKVTQTFPDDQSAIEFITIHDIGDCIIVPFIQKNL